MWSSRLWTIWGTSSGASSPRGARSTRWTWTGDGRSGPKTPVRCSPSACPAGTITSGCWRRSLNWRASTPLTRSEGGGTMLPIFDGVRDVTMLSTTLRMLLAVVCGGLIGLEREYKRRPAGFRTHILICLGAAMTTLTSQFLYLNMHYYTDMARLGAQ